jgi:predicted phage terminase large subunit-like protein
MARKVRSLTDQQFKKAEAELRELVRRSVSAFADDTAALKSARVRRARDDRQYFNETYLPHYFHEPPAPMHLELDRLAQITDHPVAVAAARGFAKTTRITFADTVHDLAFGLCPFTIIGSETEDLATEITRAIKVELEENIRLRSDFGDLRGIPWTDSELVTAGGDACPTGCKVLARGAGQAIRGQKHGPHRPVKIKLDDLESDKMVRNPKRVKELLQWIREAVMPSLDPKKGVLFVVGTLLSTKSMLAQLLKDDAWIHERFPAETADGAPAWPARFTREILDKIKATVGSKAYAKEYLLNPTDDDGLFQDDWIRRYTAADLTAVIDAGGIRTVEGIDPSTGQGMSGDFRAFAKILKSKDGIMYVRRPLIERRSLATLVTTAYARQSEEPAEEIGLEENGFLGLQLDFDREGALRGQHLPIRRIKTTVAKEPRVGRLSVYVEHGTLRFLAGDSMTDLLIEQLLSFPEPTVHDDGPDALEMAVGLLDNWGAKGMGVFEYYRQQAEQLAAGSRQLAGVAA